MCRQICELWHCMWMELCTSKIVATWIAVFLIALSTSHYYHFVSDKSDKLNFSECDTALTHMENYRILCYL